MENKFIKIILIFLSLILISIWLFGAFCWWFFTITFLTWWGGWYEIYPLSIWAIIIWVIFIYWWYKWFKKILKWKNNENIVSDKKETEL